MVSAGGAGVPAMSPPGLTTPPPGSQGSGGHTETSHSYRVTTDPRESVRDARAEAQAASQEAPEQKSGQLCIVRGTETGEDILCHTAQCVLLGLVHYEKHLFVLQRLSF